MKLERLRRFILIIMSCALIICSSNVVFSAMDKDDKCNFDAATLLEQEPLEFNDIPPNQMTISAELMEKLNSGQLIALNNNDGKTYYYRKLSSDNSRIMEPVKSQPIQHKTDTLVPMLYTSITLVILLFISLVLRDLSLLQVKALSFDESPRKLTTGISNKSVIYPLAQSFETMTAQIMDFVLLHKDLSSTLSHEIRTPLSRMRFVLELSKDQLAAPYLTRLSQDITQIEELTRNYLVFANIEHQQHRQVRQQLDAETFIKGLISKFSIYSEKIRFTLELDCEASHGNIQIDPFSMELAVQNLLANAVRYANEQIHFRLVTQERHWCLTVADDGPGFQDRYKYPTRALKRDHEKQSSGFGFGLYIVRTIAISHQGQLKIGRDNSLGGAAISLIWRRPVQ